MTYVIIPAGGEGTRLRPYTESRAKPLVPVINNFPILELVLYALSYGAELKDFIFGVKGTKNYTDLQNYFQGGSGWSAKLQLNPRVHFDYQNPNYTDTGNADSARYNIAAYNIKAPVIVCQSDNLFWGRDVSELYKHSIGSPYDFIVGLTYVDNAGHFGVAKLDKRSHKIAQFIEKPGEALKGGGLVNAGIYVIKPNAFAHLQGDFGKDVIPTLTRKGKVGGYMLEHPWYDFGNPHEHLASVLSLLKEPTPSFENFLSRVCTEYKTGRARVWLRGKSSLSLKRAVAIIRKIEAGKISVAGTVFIGKDSVIENGVALTDCAIGDLAVVGSGCTICRSNILDAWQIGRDCQIYDSFLGRGGVVANDRLIKGQFLGDHSTL
jgi:NDP-sugar pyrophosphorylase family protein